MKNIGLVLSGGMAKGAYQVGALRALSEYFKPEEIQYISAASVGVLNAYAYASYNLDGALEMWNSFNLISKKLFITTVMKSDFLKTAIKTLAQKPAVCKKLYSPLLHVKARDLLYTDISKKDPEKTADYLLASVSFLPICKPVPIDGKNYYDGATIDNIPVYPLTTHHLDYVFCIYFDEYNYSFESEQFDDRIIKITFNDDEKIISNSIWFTSENTSRMIDEGYKKTKAILDFVFANGKEDLDSIYTRIDSLNSLHPQKQLRITGDVAMNNMNKMLQSIAKRKIVE